MENLCCSQSRGNYVSPSLAFSMGFKGNDEFPLLYIMISRTEINNGTLSGMKAMPQKDSTTNGTSDFAQDRRNYSETLTSYNATTWKQKKFIGGNKDASSVAARRRVNKVGNGSLNASGGQMSFTTTRDINVTSNALRRARAGGAYVPPPKCQSIPASTDPRKYIF